jgi:restriction endonuclease S subunit
VSLAPYEIRKDSGIAWIGEVPSHWTIEALKTLASYNDDTLPEDTDPGKEIEYIEISSVDATRGVAGTETVPFGQAPSRARRLVKHGDVLISTVRTYLRAIASVVDPPSNLVASTGFTVIRPRTANSRFLGYALHSEAFIAEVISRSVGVSYPAINASELVRIGLPVPPLSEQNAIAAFLDRETAKIDRLVEAQRRLAELLTEKRQVIISHAVTQGLDGSAPMRHSGVEWLGWVPAHWGVVPVRALYRFVRRQEAADLDILSVYRDFGVIRKADRDDNTNQTPADLGSYQTVLPGDLVVNKMKSWQGSLGVSRLTGITSPDYAVFARVRDDFIDEYINYLLRCQLLPKVYRSISNGIRPNQWRLEPDRFKELRIPLPPLEEQREIAGHLAKESDRLDALAAEASRAIVLLTERRAALISAAVTGKIDLRPVTATPGRVRFLVAVEIIERLASRSTLGRVKFQKLLYLVEAHAGIRELRGNYLREAAGPLDREMLADIEAALSSSRHVTVRQPAGSGGAVTYALRGQTGAFRSELRAVLGERQHKLSGLIRTLGDLDRGSIEAVATLYAVWNDALSAGSDPTDAEIVAGLLHDWHPEKVLKFQPAELLRWLRWMREHGLVPDGTGPVCRMDRLFA